MKKLAWDIGTAYDFFISLIVLHDPSTFGLRAAWAAGMRSRLPNADRDALEELKAVVSWPPFQWLYGLPYPKNGQAILDELQAIPPGERLATLYIIDKDPETHPEHAQLNALLRDVITTGAWDDDTLTEFRGMMTHGGHNKKPSKKDAEAALEVWTNAEEYGEKLLSALRAYYEAFFAEEERRIQPALQTALERAQEMSTRMDLRALVEELSQGVSLDLEDDLDELILAPSYWSTPLIWFGGIAPGVELMCFGARPADASLVPGEMVPDLLVRALKALSDPTRLRILHYLADESLTPTQLANRLRLRPPTVVHHLKVLRMAGLVRVRISEGKEKSYAARVETVETTFNILRNFISEGGSELVGLEEAFAEEM